MTRSPDASPCPQTIRSGLVGTSLRCRLRIVAVGSDGDQRVVDRRPAERALPFVDAADHDHTAFVPPPSCSGARSSVDRSTLLASSRAWMSWLSSIVVAGAQGPDPDRVAG